MTIEPGIYHDLTSEQYFGVNAINCSQIKAAVKRSVFHMKMGKGHTMAQATADQGLRFMLACLSLIKTWLIASMCLHGVVMHGNYPLKKAVR